jgi:D-arabinose 1-dehydrogenase-like Zn-dependent alcohol dehydrogenase
MMKMKDDKTPQMATKTYAYGGRVAAAGSMEKPEKREMDAMVMKPREPYTTKEEEQKRKEEAMSFMPSIMKMKRMIG